MILYSNGDSVTWGAELDDKNNERYSKLVSNHYNAIDCNYASAGVSNDYIYRTTLRDIIHWKNTKKSWSEETGWIEDDNMMVLIGWTSPTRFEWWNGSEYIQDRLWVDYDKWGSPDEYQTTELQDKFILYQNEIIPSYIRTFNHIISLSSILNHYKIPFYFFNVFYDYKNVKNPKNKIDKFGRDEFQLSFEYYNNEINKSFFNTSMYGYLKKNRGKFLPRKHPTKESHKMWADYIIKQWL